MREDILLIGSEEVMRGGHAMQDAARQMANVSSNIQLVLEAHQRFLDDWLLRYEQVLETDRAERAR
jgi:hypothetical protein